MRDLLERLRVDLVTLTGRLYFYSKFNGEIPRSICAEALAEIKMLHGVIEELNERCENYERESNSQRER